jgi:sec-independent protein translocase protein TatC
MKKGTLRERLRHALTWPFRAVRDFMQREPEASSPDSLIRVIEKPSLLIEHIDALRGHLIRSAISLAIATMIAFAFAARILDFLAAPIGGVPALRAIEVTESIGAFMRISLLGGLVLASPYIFLEFFLFINPALKPRERTTLLSAIPASAALFVGGLVFAYYIMLPAALPFLLHFGGIVTVPRPSNYVRFVTGVLFWMGVSFEFPLVLYALAAVGWVKTRLLLRGWRVAIVVIAVLAAAITPTVDPVNMSLVMAPMIALYFLGIGLAALAERRRRGHTPQVSQ